MSKDLRGADLRGRSYQARFSDGSVQSLRFGTDGVATATASDGAVTRYDFTDWRSNGVWISNAEQNWGAILTLIDGDLDEGWLMEWSYFLDSDVYKSIGFTRLVDGKWIGGENKERQ